MVPANAINRSWYPFHGDPGVVAGFILRGLWVIYTFDDFSLNPENTMLELRPDCECCDRDLPPESTEAFICSFECTFCSDCVTQRLHGSCPNCGGNWFDVRYVPQRPCCNIQPQRSAVINTGRKTFLFQVRLLIIQHVMLSTTG